MSEDEGSEAAATDAEIDGDADPEAAVELPPEGEQLVARVADHDDELAADVREVVEAAIDRSRRVTALEEELETAQEESEDLEGRLKRKQAEFQNYKKRQDREKDRIRERATEDLVERLVGVRDNLKRALDEDHDDVESIREGVKMTLREFDRVLDAENVDEIAPEPGEDVDPQRHEVMMRVDADQPEGTVADVYSPGYEMADKVLETAQITVSTGTDEGDGSEGNGEAGDGEAEGDDGAEDDGDETAEDDAEEAAPGDIEEAVGDETSGDDETDEASEATEASEADDDAVAEAVDDGASDADDAAGDESDDGQ